MRTAEEIIAEARERAAAKEAEDLVMDLFSWAARIRGIERHHYDAMRSATLEKSQAWLIKRGRIKPEECAYHA